MLKHISKPDAVCLAFLLVAVAVTGTSKSPYTLRDKAFFADKALVDFMRPGLGITINSANITGSGAISVTYTLTDPSGLPLNAEGVTTPGVISLAYIAAYIPKGKD